MGLPEVLIFTITYAGKDYVLDKFLENVKGFTYPNTRHIFIDNSNDGGAYHKKLLSMGLEAYHTERGNNSREALARSQNFARKIALDEGYEFILSLESDVLPPKDVIQGLMKHGLPIVSARYDIGDKAKGIRLPCITVLKYNEDIRAYGTRTLYAEELPDYINKGLKQVSSSGVGCTLMTRDILAHKPFYYIPELKGHSDIFFYNELFRAKIPIYVDTDIYCEHDNVPWSTVKDR